MTSKMTSVLGAPIRGKHKWTTQWFLFCHSKNLICAGFCIDSKHISLATDTYIVSDEEEAEESKDNLTCIKREHGKYTKSGSYCCTVGWIILDFEFKNLFETTAELIQNLY